MEHIVGTIVNELKEELDEEVTVASEPSRFLRFIHMKFKCCIIALLSLIAMLLTFFLSLKELLRDEEAGRIMTKTFELVSKTYFPNATVDVVSALSNEKNK